MKTVKLEYIISILEQWLNEPVSRKKLSAEFEAVVGNNEIVNVTKDQSVLLDDLCYEFAFYTQKPIYLKEDPALKGDSEVEREVEDVLLKIALKHTNDA